MRTEDLEPSDTDTDVHCPQCRRLLNSYACRCGFVDKRDADEAMHTANAESDPEAFADAFWAVHGDKINSDSRKACEINPNDFARRAITEAVKHLFSFQ